MGLISLKEMIRELELEPVYTGDYESMDIMTSDINRPGLQFADYFHSFANETAHRLQIIGRMEMSYLENLDPKTRLLRLEKYFSYSLPCVIISSNLEPDSEMLNAAHRYKRPLLKSPLVTTRLIHKVYDFLDSQLAPRISLHGVLVDIYGVGILITGESGIGKSETALELIKRGHRLIADDAVEIKKVAEHRLVGEAPGLTRYFMEIRGIGIIDVRHMYGIGAVINNKAIDLVIHLEIWDKNTLYERLGLDEDYTTILEVKIKKLTIPVKPGRNLAVIMEAAARNFRLTAMGYHAARELEDRITAHNLEKPLE